MKLNVKPYKLLKSMLSGKGCLKNEEGTPYSPGQQNIADARFMSNGLKVMILTTQGQVYITEANNLLAGQRLFQIMAAQLADKYYLDSFIFDHIYPVNGSIAVQFHAKNNLNLLKKTEKDENSASSHENLQKGLIILKSQGNTLSFAKMMNLQVDPKQLHYFTLRQCPGIDEMLMLYI